MNPNRFRFIHDGEVEMSLSADSTLDEVVEVFKRFLYAVGYHPDNVEEAFE